MLDVKKVIRIIAARNGLALRGKADSRLLLFKRRLSGSRYTFLIKDLTILASRKVGEEFIIERFDLFNKDSLPKLDNFMS